MTNGTRIFRIVLMGVWLVVAPGGVFAATVNLFANIDGAQANAGAGTGSPGSGFANMTFDTVSKQFDWNIAWSGLQGTVTVAHFHGPATASQNAGVEVPIDITVNPAIGSAVLSAGQASDLLAGLWYINIHSTFAPGGEIRGQVQVVPVPAAALLFASGLIGLAGLARRKVTS